MATQGMELDRHHNINIHVPILAESQEEFITEHSWGYTKIGAANTAEYGVEHPRWEVYPSVQQYAVNVDFGPLYGPEFECLANKMPSSVFLAVGSSITVREGTRLPRASR